MLLQAGQRLADALVGLRQQVGPARLLRHVEGGLVPTRHLDHLWDVDVAVAGLPEMLANLLLALLDDIGAALQDQHAIDVFLELRAIHAATQDVGRVEQVPFQLVEGELRQVVRHLDAELLRHWAVSPRVNRPTFDDPSLIEPADP